MDTTIILITALLAIVILGSLVTFRSQVRVSLRLPLNIFLKLTGSNKPTNSQPGVQLTDATSHSGGASLVDKTGRGAVGERIDVNGDIEVSSTPPPQKNSPK